MNPDLGMAAELIWATRGRQWGFRFLLDGGLRDPLLEYERLFADLGDAPTAYRRVGGRVAIRFPDPEGRLDAAGRVIPHEFILSGQVADGIHSEVEGLEQIWPLVASAYARVWDAEEPPSAADLRFPAQDRPTSEPSRSNGDG